MLWKTFKLYLSLGEKMMVVLLPPIHLSASANLWSSPCLLPYLRPFYKTLTHWKESWSSSGSCAGCAPLHGLLPCVKHLAHKLIVKSTPEEVEKVCQTAVPGYLWTPAKSFSLKNSSEEKRFWSPRVHGRCEHSEILFILLCVVQTLFTGLGPMVSVSIRCMW